MKKSLLNLALTASLLSSTALVATQAVAVEGLSANASVTSNYIWRGITQTGNGAAVQGGIDYENGGFYTGTWVSNVSGGTETDFYAGFGGDISESVSFDVGYIYYAYFDLDESDFSEVYGSISWGGLDVGVAVMASSDFDADFGDTLYANADYTFDLGSDLGLTLHVGSYTGDALADDLIDFGASLSKSDFTFGVSKSDLDADNADDVKFYASYSMDFDL